MKMVLLNPNFGDNIRFARVLKGLSQQELGESISTSRQFVFQLETGVRTPTSEVLSAICESLFISPKFLEIEVHSEIQPEQCHFRKRRSTPNSLAARVATFGTLLVHLMKYIEQFIDIPAPFEFEPLGIDIGHDGSYSRQQIENTSDRFRLRYGLGQDTPIDNLTALLENLGIVVTSFNGVSDKVDALSFSRSRHFILRNTEKASVCRQRLDLAHELGHLILHQGIETGTPLTEAEADHFASAFLFPSKAFIREFPICLTIGGSFKWDRLLLLKRRWKVSLKAIIYRAHSLGLLDSRQYRAANVKLSKDGRTEPLDQELEMESPSLLNESFDILKNQIGISFTEISKSIGINPKYLSDMLALQRNDLLVDDTNIIALRPLRLA